MQNTRHKSLCVAAYLLRRGARERWWLWGRGAAPNRTVIVRENTPARSLPGGAYESLARPLSFAPSLL